MDNMDNSYSLEYNSYHWVWKESVKETVNDRVGREGRRKA